MSMIKLFQNFNDLKKTNINDSKWFSWHEALYLKTVNAYAIPSVEQAVNIMKVCKVLDNVREFYNTPITITSWLRPDVYNKIIGGATFSYHRSGLAVDFLVMGLNSEKVRQDLKANPQLLLGASMEEGTVHVHIQLDGRAMTFNPPPKKASIFND